MAPAQISKFALFWFLLVIPLAIIDGVFVLTRASPTAEDPTHPLAKTIPFKYWTIYANHDRRYQPNNDVFVVVQSYLGLVEVALGILVVLLEVAAKNHVAALKLAICVSMMTLYKTVIFYAMDYANGCEYTKHNTAMNKFLVVTLPSCFWIIIPAFLIWQCFEGLKLGEVKAKAKHSGKPSPKKSKKN